MNFTRVVFHAHKNDLDYNYGLANLVTTPRSMLRCRQLGLATKLLIFHTNGMHVADVRVFLSGFWYSLGFARVMIAIHIYDNIVRIAAVSIAPFLLIKRWLRRVCLVGPN